MSNYKDTQREEFIDQTQRLLIMGFEKPYQIQKMLKVADLRTAKNYIAIARRRVVRMNRTREPEILVKVQCDLYDQAIREIWKALLGAISVNEKTGCINSLQKLLKGKAELLGLEEPKKLLITKDEQTPLSDLFNKMTSDEQDKAIAVFEQLLTSGDETDTIQPTIDDIHSTGGLQERPEGTDSELETGNTA